MRNTSRNVKNWQRNRKADLVKLFGSKCWFCGIEGHPCIYDFHHINGDKEFGLSGSTKSFEKLIEEAKKCIMLCANCHRLIHYGIIKIDIYYDQTITNEKIKEILDTYKTSKKKKYKCKFCNNISYNKKYCSQLCKSLDSRKVEWPSKEKLEKMLLQKSKSEIGRMYGVSVNAVIKWIKSYNIGS